MSKTEIPDHLLTPPPSVRAPWAPQDAAESSGTTYEWQTYPDWVDANDPFECAVYDAKIDEAKLLLKKHRDYGPKNIAMSPGGPLNGLAVRLWDKIARLFNLKDQEGTANEPLRDTGLDIANYGTIATLVIDGKWPDA